MFLTGETATAAAPDFFYFTALLIFGDECNEPTENETCAKNKQ